MDMNQRIARHYNYRADVDQCARSVIHALPQGMFPTLCGVTPTSMRYPDGTFWERCDHEPINCRRCLSKGAA